MPAFRIGSWQVQPTLGRIRRGSEEVRLAPKFMAVLVELARADGEVVTREDLLNRVWEGVVVGESVLTRAVSELRSAMDVSGRPSVIETIPTIGYRLTVPVAGTSQPRAQEVKGRIAFAFLLLALVLFVALRWWESSPSGESGRLRQVPLTSLPGEEFDPSFSPDGTRLAYARVEGLDNQSDIYTQGPRGSTQVQITDTELQETSPAWAPDGQFLVFVQCDPLGGTARIVSRSLSGFGDQEIADLGRVECDAPPKVSWTPSGDALVVGATRIGDGLRRVDLSSREVTAMTAPPADQYDDLPRFSHDGSRLAFTRQGPGAAVGEIWTARTDGSDPIRTARVVGLRGMDWTQSGDLVYAQDGELWRLKTGSALSEWVAAPGVDVVQPTISRADGSLVFVQSLYDVNIWGKSEAGDERQVQATNRIDRAPALSPDGALAFLSDRDGSCALFVGLTDGRDATPRTRFEEDCFDVTAPVWSPDGSRIALGALATESPAVWIVPAAGGNARSYSIPGTTGPPGWAADGQSVFVSSGEAAWRMAVDDGELSPVPLTAVRLAEAVEGDWLYFTREEGILMRVPTGGAFDREEVVATGVAPLNWRPVTGGVLFTVRGKETVVLRYEEGLGARPISSVPGQRVGWIDATLDESWIVYEQVDRDEDDLFRLEGFK